MPLDPQAKMVLDLINSMGSQSLSEIPVEQSREQFKMLASFGGSCDPLFETEDVQIPGPAGNIRARIYRPSGEKGLPAIVYFHGGGWVIGAIETHDGFCRSLANKAECIVISVDYRLAPENKFPAAPEDCYAATRWVQQNAEELGIDRSRIAVGGDSAGGNLAAVVSLMLRDKDEPIPVFQLLIYPATDYYDPPKPSLKENGEGYLLTFEDMVWFLDQYLPSKDEAKNPLVSPLRAESLAGLPSALIITAEYDPLRDDGEMYAARLREFGVQAEARRYDGMIHGFVSLAAMIDKGRTALNETAESLKTALLQK